MRYIYGADGSGRELTCEVEVIEVQGALTDVRFPEFVPRFDTMTERVQFQENRRLVRTSRIVDGDRSAPLWQWD